MRWKLVGDGAAFLKGATRASTHGPSTAADRARLALARVDPRALVQPGQPGSGRGVVAAISSCHCSRSSTWPGARDSSSPPTRRRGGRAARKNERGAFWVSAATVNPRIVYGGDRQPTPADVERLHHLAHEQCFIANSVKTEIRVAGSGDDDVALRSRPPSCSISTARSTDSRAGITACIRHGARTSSARVPRRRRADDFVGPRCAAPCRPCSTPGIRRSSRKPSRTTAPATDDVASSRTRVYGRRARDAGRGRAQPGAPGRATAKLQHAARAHRGALRVDPALRGASTGPKPADAIRRQAGPGRAPDRGGRGPADTSVMVGDRASAIVAARRATASARSARRGATATPASSRAPRVDLLCESRAPSRAAWAAWSSEPMPATSAPSRSSASSTSRRPGVLRGLLGFRVDWEHRFRRAAPLYMQVSRDGLVLHLSEHHGDACPGSQR